jgi:hypothetical protein
VLANTVLIHATGWVKVPVQFLALAVVAKAKNYQNSFELARVLVRFDHVARIIVNADHGRSTQGLGRRSGQRLL